MGWICWAITMAINFELTEIERAVLDQRMVFIHGMQP